VGHCSACGIETPTRCSGCKRIYYCSTKCQNSDWASHKEYCIKVTRERKEQEVTEKQLLDKLRKVAACPSKIMGVWTPEGSGSSSGDFNSVAWNSNIYHAAIKVHENPCQAFAFSLLVRISCTMDIPEKYLKGGGLFNLLKGQKYKILKYARECKRLFASTEGTCGGGGSWVIPTESIRKIQRVEGKLFHNALIRGTEKDACLMMMVLTTGVFVKSNEMSNEFFMEKVKVNVKHLWTWYQEVKVSQCKMPLTALWKKIEEK